MNVVGKRIQTCVRQNMPDRVVVQNSAREKNRLFVISDSAYFLVRRLNKIWNGYFTLANKHGSVRFKVVSAILLNRLRSDGLMLPILKLRLVDIHDTNWQKRFSWLFRQDQCNKISFGVVSTTHKLKPFLYLYCSCRSPCIDIRRDFRFVCNPAVN